MNPASVFGIFRSLFQRGHANQPDVAFPQLPGIIPETFTGNLLIAAAYLGAFNELTTLSSKYQQLTRKTYTLVIHRMAAWWLAAACLIVSISPCAFCAVTGVVHHAAQGKEAHCEQLSGRGVKEWRNLRNGEGTQEGGNFFWGEK